MSLILSGFLLKQKNEILKLSSDHFRISCYTLVVFDMLGVQYEFVLFQNFYYLGEKVSSCKWHRLKVHSFRDRKREGKKTFKMFT